MQIMTISSLIWHLGFGFRSNLFASNSELIEQQSRREVITQYAAKFKQC